MLTEAEANQNKRAEKVNFKKKNKNPEGVL